MVGFVNNARSSPSIYATSDERFDVSGYRNAPWTNSSMGYIAAFSYMGIDISYYALLFGSGV